jgi:hypothetical protein
MKNLMELNFNVEVFIIDGNFECSSIYRSYTIEI